MLTPGLLRELQRRLGPGHVYTRTADLAAYAYDAYGAAGERRVPAAVVFPGSAAEVAAVISLCAADSVPVIARGAGTGYCGGAVSDGGVILSLVRLHDGPQIDAQHAHAGAGAGVVTAALHAAADAAGLYYPPDPGAATTSTLGGNIALNAGGPHSLRYGNTADFVTGITAVLADGRVVTVGGKHGGEDLFRILLGSEGTLAVITAATFRLLPKPASRATLAATFKQMEAAAAALGEINGAGVLPAALEFMDRSALEAIAAAGGPQPQVETAAWLLVEVEGDTQTTTAQADAVRTALTRAGTIRVDVAGSRDEADALWAKRKAVSAAVAKVMIGKVNEDVVVPRDRLTELVTRARQAGEKQHLQTAIFGHWGDGNLHVTYLIDPRIPEQRRRGAAAAEELFATVLEMGGSISGEHGIGTTKLAYVERQLGAAGVEMMRNLKQALDPAGILNPGKLIPPFSGGTATALTDTAVESVATA